MERLDKIIANRGIASRREVKELLRQGFAQELERTERCGRAGCWWTASRRQRLM